MTTTETATTTTTTTSSIPNTNVIGDINQDGMINLQDAIRVLQLLRPNNITVSKTSAALLIAVRQSANVALKIHAEDLESIHCS